MGIGWYKTISFNNSSKRVTSSLNGKVNVVLKSNEAGNDKWVSNIKDFINPDIEEDYTGETCSCIIENLNKFDISNWKLRLNIKQECYLNGFWCGDFEVHQFRDNQEIVERINNSKIDINNLTLENNTSSNNLLIRLLPDDYLVYYPSVSAKEDIIKAQSSVGIGFIFYYKDSIDFSSYVLNYNNDLKMKDSIHFKIVVCLIILWLFGLLFFHALLILNNKFKNEMKQSIRNISIMAELYHEVHMINLDSDTGYLIKGDQDELIFNFIGCKVKDAFRKYIDEDCSPSYKPLLTEFLNLESLEKRLLKTSSVSMEYKSLKYGWCLLRFLKMDKTEKIEQLIFTLQDINTEKAKIDADIESSKQDDFLKIVRSKFLDIFSFSTNGILNDVLQANSELKTSVDSEKDQKLCRNIENSIGHFKLLQQCINDMFNLEANTFKLNQDQYNIYETLDELIASLIAHYENKAFKFEQAIDKGIPEKLEGDTTRLKQILMLILVSTFQVTEKGFVKFSLFAKTKDDVEELLFSIRDTGKGFTEEQLVEIHTFLNGNRINRFDNPSLVFLKIIDGILKSMGSELKISSCYGEGTEFYFTIKQKIV